MGKRGKAGIFIAITGLLLISAGLLRHRQAWEEDRGNIPSSVTFFAMDTVITIEAYDGEEGAGKAAEELIGRLEQKWSATEAGSEVYELNRSQGTFKPVSEETQELSLNLQ